MSTGYPYLNVARRLNVDYGHVLWYADYLEKTKGGIPSNDQQRIACEMLSYDVRIAVCFAFQMEQERRNCAGI